uniref:ABC transporter permease n=1 Tax=Angiostrongylus cantonensis TaxID=6313 RepID=A0A0K0D9M7_ANGCA
LQKGPDYGAIIIRTAAGVVIFISLSLIVLVVGNMIYTSLTNQVHFRERVSDVFSRLLYTGIEVKQENA